MLELVFVIIEDEPAFLEELFCCGCGRRLMNGKWKVGEVEERRSGY